MTERPLKEMSVAELLGRLLLFPIWIVEYYYKRNRTLRAQARQQSVDRSEQLRKVAVEQEDARAKQQAAQQAFHEAAEREAVRYRCQLAYDKHSHLLQGNFSEEKLAKYFSQYMNDNTPLETVLRRATELEQLIAELSGKRSGESKERTFTSIKDEFDKKREEARNANADPEVLEAIILELNYQEDQAMMRAARDG